MRLFRSSGDVAAIEVNRQHHISLVRKLRRLFLDPVVESIPFVDRHQRRKWTFSFGHVENAFYGFVAALIGDVFGGGGKCGGNEQKDDREDDKLLHHSPLMMMLVENWMLATE